MGKYKVTEELLFNIEQLAKEQYDLDDIIEELNLSKKLIKNEDVLEAFKMGQVSFFIEYRAQGEDDDFMEMELNIDVQQCQEWDTLYADKILDEKKDIERLKLIEIKMQTDASYIGATNLKAQKSYSDIEGEWDSLNDAIESKAEAIINGDMTELIKILTTNTIQLEHINFDITQYKRGESGKKVSNFNTYSNIQFKAMQEMRKNIMAINEIVNPKRTTFIKQANQHNHLHQEQVSELSQKKEEENKNELQNPLSLEYASSHNSTDLIKSEVLKDEKEQ